MSPIITGVNAAVTLPVLNANISFTVSITNARVVSFNYRFSREDKFIKITMYDGGAHNDGNANDNIYMVQPLL